jgi:NitT/TauT family transport system ATP-binding protein
VLALDDVSFMVADGEFVSIVGPSGCGKTTLLKLLAGLIQPTSGEIAFERPRQNGHLPSALVFQDDGLYPWMDVVDNVAFGLEARGVGRRERRARARAFIDRVGLGAFAGSLPHELSGGMRQRVGIVRALVADARMLLMDEPFGSLDAQTKLVLEQDLLRIWKEEQKTVVYVTHDIVEAILLGDRVLVMTGHPGRIREEIRVPLDRPRDLVSGAGPDVTAIKRHIWALLEQEVRKNLKVDA